MTLAWQVSAMVYVLWVPASGSGGTPLLEQEGILGEKVGRRRPLPDRPLHRGCPARIDGLLFGVLLFRWREV